jgi:hypothetical protein
MAICSAYFDASGKVAAQPAVVVSGFAAPVSKWVRFETNWKGALDAEDIKVFHATDFAASEGEFKGWKGDKLKRRRFVRSLIEVIRKDTNKMLSVGVETGAWKRVDEEYELQEHFHSPYALAGYMVVRLSSKWAHGKGHKFPIETFFEDGDEGQGGLKVLCKLHHGLEPIFLPKEKLPFQAADFLAWKQRIAMTNSMRLELRLQDDPDIETFGLMMNEWKSLSRSAPNTGDFMIFSENRLIENCVNNGVPKRRRSVVK